MSFLRITTLATITIFSMVSLIHSSANANTLGGTYLKTCRNPSEFRDQSQGLILKALCKRTNGLGWNNSQLEHAELCVGDIENINGNLQCHYQSPPAIYKPSPTPIHTPLPSPPPIHTPIHRRIYQPSPPAIYKPSPTPIHRRIYQPSPPAIYKPSPTPIHRRIYQPSPPAIYKPSPTPIQTTSSSIPIPTPIQTTSSSIPIPTPIQTTSSSIPIPTPIQTTSSSIPIPIPIPKPVSNWKKPYLVYTLNAKSRTDVQTISKNLPPGVSSSYPLAISPYGDLLASAGLSEVRLWNLYTGKETTYSLTTTQGFRPIGIHSIAFSTDGKLLVTASNGSFLQKNSSEVEFASGIVQVWDISTHSLLVSLNSTLIGMTKINSSGQLNYCTADGEIVSVNLKGKDVFSFPLFNFKNQNFAVLQNESILATAISSDKVEFHDFQDGKLLDTLNLNHDNLNSRDVSKKAIVAVSPDGSMFAFGNDQNFLTIMNVQDLRTKLINKVTIEKKQFAGDRQEKITFIAFSPDNKFIATANDNKTVKLWDVNTGTLLKTISEEENQNQVTSLAFGSDGKTLVFSDVDGKIFIWRNY